MNLCPPLVPLCPRTGTEGGILWQHRGGRQGGGGGITKEKEKKERHQGKDAKLKTQVTKKQWFVLRTGLLESQSRDRLWHLQASFHSRHIPLMKLGSQSKRVYKLDYSEHHFNKNIKLSKMQCFWGDLNFYLLKNLSIRVFPGGAVECRGHRFDPWSGKILQAMKQLRPWATTTESAL